MGGLEKYATFSDLLVSKIIWDLINLLIFDLIATNESQILRGQVSGNSEKFPIDHFAEFCGGEKRNETETTEKRKMCGPKLIGIGISRVSRENRLGELSTNSKIYIEWGQYFAN